MFRCSTPCIQHFLLECKMLLVNNCNPVRFPFDGYLNVYEAEPSWQVSSSRGLFINYIHFGFTLGSSWVLSGFFWVWWVSQSGSIQKLCLEKRCSMMYNDVQWCSMIFNDVLWCSIMFNYVESCVILLNNVWSCSILYFSVKSSMFTRQSQAGKSAAVRIHAKTTFRE